ncbi:MAG: pyridoxal phosphate-dependent aminotransferase [Patescibacteria group bacterium]|nr:pyridoxal phosphate-dependent aminotransferase [Patescibacteria group bacterium]
MPPLLAVLRFVVALCNPWGHGYAERQGRFGTRKAIARNVRLTLGSVLNESQILLLEGSKPAIRYVLQGLGLVGNVVLPMPFYPGNLDSVLGAGCKPYHIAMPTVEEFIYNLKTALMDGLRPVAVVLSFDNPRWLPRNKDDYQYLVDLARRYRFVLVSDEAYRDLAFDGQVSSLMQVPGWEKVGVCIQTASKPFCMAGWKLGAVIASSENLPKILAVKGRDSEGGSPAAQKAWATALWCTRYPRNLARKYHRRARFTVEKLYHVEGVEDLFMPFGGMFIYFRIRGWSSAEFAARFQELGFEVSPGERFGEPNHIRWCLNQENWVTKRAIAAAARILKETPQFDENCVTSLR